MDKRMLPVSCPSCGQALKVRRLECPSCDTAVEGCFGLPVLARLTREEQEFLVSLVLCGGSLKELAAVYGVSYPTVRNRLDALIARVRFLSAGSENDEGKESSE
ncbi:MAG: DUF2089 family protein [Candidatus Hydrogenedentes bacterium]|nr:DUF2089 family protein [Candidatus Hydrogenedentota bacterium]